MHPESLFLEIGKLTSRKEDLFTLAVAATLGEDERLLRLFLKRVVGVKHYRRLSRSSRVTVRTQVIHPAPRCILDMVIDVDGRPFLVLEHKLWSPEGKDQVSKYLSLPRSAAPRVAFIAGYYAKSVTGSESTRYLRHPSKRLHFVWSDFYDLFGALDKSSLAYSGLRVATKDLFDKYLFQPTHWAVAGLRDADPIRRAAADEKVESLTRPARESLERAPYSYDTGSSWTTKSEFYATDGNSKRLPEVRVAPGVIPGALKMVLKCTSKAYAFDVWERLKGRLPATVERSSIIEYHHLGYSGRGNPHAIEILTPWSTLLGRYALKKDWPRMAEALRRHVVGIVAVAR